MMRGGVTGALSAPVAVGGDFSVWAAGVSEEAGVAGGALGSGGGTTRAAAGPAVPVISTRGGAGCSAAVDVSSFLGP
jgi:hypothetical protein